MGTLLVVPTEAKTGKFPPSWEGVPCGGTVRVLQIDRKRKLEKIKKKIEEKEKGEGGMVERDTKPKIETKKVQTRNNKTQLETQAMLNGNERRDLRGGKTGGGTSGSERKGVCNHVCVRERRNKNNL